MNTFNKNTILCVSVGAFLVSGCVSKNEVETVSKTPTAMNLKHVQKPKSSWSQIKPLSNGKKEDCIDCYATPIEDSKPPSYKNNLWVKAKYPANGTQATTIKRSKTKTIGSYSYEETASDTTVKEDAYANQYIASPRSTTNASQGSFSQFEDLPVSQQYDGFEYTAIQVGAFRKYSGAMKYVKKYNELSDKYNVAMKKGRKNNKPLYRVRIEGFKTKSEAKKFMYSYNISDGFLVR